MPSSLSFIIINNSTLTIITVVDIIIFTVLLAFLLVMKRTNCALVEKLQSLLINFKIKDELAVLQKCHSWGVKNVINDDFGHTALHRFVACFLVLLLGLYFYWLIVGA